MPTDRTLRNFFSNILITLTLADNKFVRALKLVLIKPGFLSSEYAEGRRVNYLRPLQLFFILNLVYFLFPLLQLFNTSLHTQMYLRMHSPIVRKMVNSELRETGFSMESYALLYNEKSTRMAKLVIIAFVFIASLPLAIIFRQKKRYLTDHLTLSVELATFNLAMNAIMLSFFLMLVNSIIHMTHSGWEKYLDDFTLTIIFILTNLYFLFGAARRFYSQRGFWLVVKVVMALLGLFVALELYRLVLFFVTYWSL